MIRISATTPFALAVLLVLFASACSVAPEFSTAEAPDTLAFVDDGTTPNTDANASTNTGTDTGTEENPPTDDESEAASVEMVEQAPASDEFCSVAANVWVHSAALNLLAGDANAEMNRIGLLNVAEWLERSTLQDEATERDDLDLVAMFDAFTSLQATVDADFDGDWQGFQVSTSYANDAGAQTYEAERAALVTVLNNDCDSVDMSDLRADAQFRADDLVNEFATSPSSVVESDSLPGHSIFTHSGGRLIASFPSAWDYREGNGDAIVDLIASPDVESFLAGDAIDGVHLQLVEAASLVAFRTELGETSTSNSCLRTNDLVDNGVTRQNVTQTFECSDHGATIIGQFSEARGLGLIIEASFDRVEPSRSDLTRLATIANSALWS